MGEKKVLLFSQIFLQNKLEDNLSWCKKKKQNRLGWSRVASVCAKTLYYINTKTHHRKMDYIPYTIKVNIDRTSSIFASLESRNQIFTLDSVYEWNFQTAKSTDGLLNDTIIFSFELGKNICLNTYITHWKLGQ